MSGSFDQGMEVDFDQAQAEAARGTTGESGGTDVMDLIAGGGVYAFRNVRTGGN